jgi:hypothetical protein
MLIFLLVVIICANTAEALVVVVKKENSITSLTQREIVDIFMGRFSTFPDGSSARPIDLPAQTKTKNEFYMLLVNQNERKVNAYWARLLFSGRAKPPEKTSSIDEVLSKLMEYEGTIAYIPESAVNDSVKVVFSFDKN